MRERAAGGVRHRCPRVRRGWRAATRRPAADRGFSLLEITVAIVILGIVMAAAAPQMVSSIHATGKAKLVSRAKGVLQGQLDSMRTIPFRVAPSAGDHRDLLDTYYRNVTAPSAPSCGTAAAPAKPLTAWTGYVSAASSARCSYEPPTGAYYRKVLAPGTGDLPANFAVVVDTQFLSASTPPTVVAPLSTFDSQVTGRDRPPSSQVGVTATVLYSTFGKWTPVTVYTQIASRTPTDIRIRLEARATAMEVGAVLDSGDTISLTGGQLDLTGSLANTSQAKASLSAISGASSVDGRKNGAALAVDAPYTNLLNLSVSSDGLGSGCSETCWGATLLPPFVAAADNGLPRIGVSGLPGLLNPVQTTLPDNVTRDGFQFRGSTPQLPGLQTTLVSLDSTPPVGELLTGLASGLFHCAFSLVGATSHVTSSGYINSTDELSPTNPLSVEACGGARTNVIRLLPTTTAPDGLVRVTLKSSAKCTVTGAGHAPTTSFDYRADVEYWTWTPGLVVLGVTLVPGHGEYVSAGTITPATTTDPLASVALTTAVSDTETLGTYIESWGGLTRGQVTATTTSTATSGVAEVAIPALFTLQTKALANDDDTALSFAAGATSCRAEDKR